MAETNKSQLMSEAEIIEAINADSLISVSLGAGQPQKNVKMSTLASVAAGLIGVATNDKNGLMPASLTIANIHTGNPLNFNDCKDLWRLYCSFGGENAPITGNYYWGFFNVGFNSDWFTQIACASYADGALRMYRRTFHSGKVWGSWEHF